jgi:hypothetical protein
MGLFEESLYGRCAEPLVQRPRAVKVLGGLGEPKDAPRVQTIMPCKQDGEDDPFIQFVTDAFAASDCRKEFSCPGLHFGKVRETLHELAN